MFRVSCCLVYWQLPLTKTVLPFGSTSQRVCGNEVFFSSDWRLGREMWPAVLTLVAIIFKVSVWDGSLGVCRVFLFIFFMYTHYLFIVLFLFYRTLRFMFWEITHTHTHTLSLSLLAQRYHSVSRWVTLLPRSAYQVGLIPGCLNRCEDRGTSWRWLAQ